MAKRARRYLINLSPKVKDWITIIIFFETGIISFNRFGTNASAYILGLLFLIAGLYGIICMYKKARFLF